MSAMIRPIGHLKSFIGGQVEIEVPAGLSVREALAHIGIEPLVVALVTVNEEQKDKDYILQDGDIVRALAVIGGG